MGKYTEHRDDGSGRCGFCFEEWPCTHIQRGGWGSSGIQAWEREVRNRQYEIEKARSEVLAAKLNAFFEEVGLNTRYHTMSRSIQFSLDDFIKLMDFFAVDVSTYDREDISNGHSK